MFSGDDPLLEGDSAKKSFLRKKSSTHKLIISNKTFLIIFIPLGIICCLIGYSLLQAKTNYSEVKKEYSSVCKIGNICELTIEIREKMKFPIGVLFEITNFYPSHWKLISSRSDKQLLGKYVSFDGMKKCVPYRSIRDDPERANWILPCGLQAHTFFNDTFEIEDFRLSLIDQQKTGIRVKPLNALYRGNLWPWPDVSTMLRFSMWMDSAAFPNFRKLYGVMQSEYEYLEPRNLTVYIMNFYNNTAFSGTKSVVLTTMGESPQSMLYLSILFIITGLVLSIGSFVLYLIKSKKSGRAGKKLTQFTR